MSKRILVYGDSNTWGYDPNTDRSLGYEWRLPYEQRYTGVLQQQLGDSYHVIDEGHNGRTTVWEDPIVPHRNGLKYLEACIETHMPIDVMAIMLGTNDMKPRICAYAPDSAMGVKKLVQVVQASKCGRNGKPPKVIIIAPAPISKGIENGIFADEFGGLRAREESLKMAGYLKTVAQELNCAFLDAGEHASLGIDDIHLDVAGHAGLAKALAQCVREIV